MTPPANDQMQVVLKKFRDASGDRNVAALAFVTFCEELKLLDCSEDVCKSRLATAHKSTYQYHLSQARETQFRAVTKNDEFVKLSAKMDEYQNRLAPLVTMSKSVMNDRNNRALEKVFDKYSRNWLGAKLPYWLETVMLGVVASVGAIVFTFLVATALATNGFYGVEVRAVAPPIEAKAAIAQ